MQATSALDAESEALVQEALDRVARGRTVVTIAHRLSTVQSAAEVVVIQDGTIAESGSHNNLLARGELPIQKAAVPTHAMIIHQPAPVAPHRIPISKAFTDRWPYIFSPVIERLGQNLGPAKSSGGSHEDCVCRRHLCIAGETAAAAQQCRP